MPDPRLAFLGCGFITHVHSRHLRSLKADVVTSYASRDKARAEAFCRRYRGTTARQLQRRDCGSNIDAIVVAVPPRFHLDLTLQALAAEKHVLVEKPLICVSPTTAPQSMRATRQAASSAWVRTIITSRSPCA